MQARKVKAIRPIWPNAAIRQRYQHRMVALIRDMAASVEHWLTAERRADPPMLASDALPSEQMQAKVHRLYEKWLKRFEEDAGWMAESFLRRSNTSQTVSQQMSPRTDSFQKHLANTQASLMVEPFYYQI